jgi:hypothetical protein
LGIPSSIIYLPSSSVADLPHCASVPLRLWLKGLGQGQSRLVKAGKELFMKDSPQKQTKQKQ